MKKPLNIILDTDIGTDSDDVGAMMVLHRLHAEGRCNLLAVTSSTSRRDGAAIIDVINRFYGHRMAVGGVRGKSVCASDEYGGYSRAVSAAYANDYTEKDPEDAVAVLRRTLAAADGKVRLVSIGSFANIAGLLKSVPDDVSPLAGIDLVRQKVSDMYSMAGSFFRPQGCPEIPFDAEYNIMLCLDDSIYVAENFPAPVTYSPWELGVQIRTGEKLLAGADNPMKMAYYVHNGAPRESWDPVTAFAAVGGDELFAVRENVTVTVSESGATTFTDGGKDRILTAFADRERVRREIENLMCV